jgi:glycosyltransferase involved in cell wall biosynthesis
MTLSIVRGEEGNQARELDHLISWLKTQSRPDVICLSNALLLGMVRRLKSELSAPVVCMLQGEDSFLDALPESHRDLCWKTVAERAKEADLLVAPSRYFGDLMAHRLGLPAAQVRVVHNGINVEGYGEGGSVNQPGSPTPTVGYFARMCKEKGLDTLVAAYIELRQRDRVKNVKLRVGGSSGPADQVFVEALRKQLAAAGVLNDVEFCPNLTRSAKLNFLRSLSVFSVPARFGEAFGLYLLEALAAGVPVVQPRTAAFPELIEATSGGLLCEPENAKALADKLEELLLAPERLRALGEAGRRAVFKSFTAEVMAAESLKAYQEVCARRAAPAIA